MLNIKKTLTKLFSRIGVEEFNLTVYAGFDNSFGVGKYDKATDTVRLFCWGTDTANLPTGTALFTVPEEYRPSGNVALLMVFGASGGSGTYYSILNSSNGAITQSAGSTLRSVVIWGEYKLGGVIRTLKNAISNLYREGVAVC